MFYLGHKKKFNDKKVSIRVEGLVLLPRFRPGVDVGEDMVSGYLEMGWIKMSLCLKQKTSKDKNHTVS